VTTALLVPREYQRNAEDNLFADWAAGLRRCAVVHATGLGKTVVLVHVIARFLEENPGKRAIVLVHTDELIGQTVKKLRWLAPSLPYGIVKGTRNEVLRRVIVVSVQSLRTERRRKMIRNVGLIVIDECHRSIAPTYRNILTHYGAYASWCDECTQAREAVAADQGSDPGAPTHCPTPTCAANAPLVAGFTATLARGDNQKLSEVWQKVSDQKDISWGVRHRYLIPPRGKRIEIPDLDLKDVKRSGGDFERGSLGAALEKSLAPEIVAKAYLEHAQDPMRPGRLRSGILFAPTIASAEAFAEAFAEVGIKAESLSYLTPETERAAVVARLMDGTTTVVCNPTLLTEGFDAPRVSCIVMARPTRSKVLYTQCVGRGVRPDDTLEYDGQDCLILDAVGASNVHGLASLVDLSEQVIEYRDDVSLIDLEDELGLQEREAGEDVGRLVHRGPVEVVDFDPLSATSRLVWQRTAAGAYFVPAGAGRGSVYVFISPAVGPDVTPGTWDLYWCTQDYRDDVNGKRGERTEHCALPLSMAFAWGEDLVDEMTPPLSIRKDRKAGWRNSPPTDKIRTLARQLGITVPADARKMGPIADLIDVMQATRRVDPIVAHFAKGGD